MEQGLDKSKPPSTSYRETYRRHRKLLIAPVILGALAAAFFLFGSGKTYKSTASLWIDTTPPVPSSIGASTSSAPLAEPPATSEQGVLAELLTTQSFDSSIAETSLLGKSLGSVAAIQTKAPTLLGTGQVVSTIAGSQVLQISYSAASPAMAQSVLAAVVTQLRDYSNRLTAEHNQAAVGYDSEQVKAAENALATARSSVAAYQAQHPGANQSDPNYASLVAAENNAATQLAQANTALGQVTGSPDAGGWSIAVLDPASQAQTTPPKKKKVVEVILAGAFGGVLISFLAVIALTPAKKEAWDDELSAGKAFAPDALPADPARASSSAASPAFAQSTPARPAVGQARLSVGYRRFHFRGPSAPLEEQ
jgi:uncharacterized protein involved in exopolysaccharide biosynthesis